MGIPFAALSCIMLNISLARPGSTAYSRYIACTINQTENTRTRLVPHQVISFRSLAGLLQLAKVLRQVAGAEACGGIKSHCYGLAR
jgi:hypothetical protein